MVAMSLKLQHARDVIPRNALTFRHLGSVFVRAGVNPNQTDTGVPCYIQYVGTNIPGLAGLQVCVEAALHLHVGVRGGLRTYGSSQPHIVCQVPGEASGVYRYVCNAKRGVF